MENALKIYPPYQVFYMESLLSITSSAITSIDIFIENLDEVDAYKNDLHLLDLLQNIINQTAMLSKYFFVHESKRDIHRNRAEHLRELFQIADDSILRDKTVRNFIEHFDEKLDELFSKPIAGTFYPNFIGFKEQLREPLFVFRAYYLDEQYFEILDKKFHIKPIFDEIIRIHNCAIEYIGK